MRKMLKIAAILVVVLLTVGGVSLFSVYEASRQVPEFYRHAISRDLGDEQEARDEFVVQATALASDLHRAGRWQSLFTSDQINAWFSLELAKNYPDLLPGELRDPRIEIGENEATIACRYGAGDRSSVLSLTVDVYLQGPNTLAVRVRHARAGALPVPLGQVLDGISQAARQLNLRLEWRKTHGDPVAQITFSRPHVEGFEALKLDTIELRQGELFLAGTISSEQGSPSPVEPQPNRAPTAGAESPQGDHPLVGAAAKETRQE